MLSPQLRQLVHPQRFGRRQRAIAAAVEQPASLSADLRLFLTSFAGGLVFMGVYLA